MVRSGYLEEHIDARPCRRRTGSSAGIASAKPPCAAESEAAYDRVSGADRAT
jgi:hypothetical protein